MSNLKKIIAVILALVMTAAVMPVAFAESVSYTQNCPYIYIHGFVGNTIYDNPTSPDAKALFPPEADDIVKTVERCTPALGAYLINKNSKALASAIIPELLNLFGDFIPDKDGNVKSTSGVKFKYPPKSAITKTSSLKFEYDWRIDPMESAEQLNDFIDYVLDASGCNKVGIMAHSCGGIIALSYVSKYGTDKIQGIVMNSTAIYGETYTGELMTGEMKIDLDAVKAFMRYALNENEYDEAISGIIDVLADSGFLDFVERFGNNFIADMYDDIMGSVIFPMFAYMPTIWAMIPDEYLADAFDFVFNGDFTDKSCDYSVLKAKIANYNSAVRENREDMLYDLENNGHFGVYARYGFSSIPLTSSWKNLSDGIIDTKFASFGATTAEYGKTLPAEYTASVDAKYISPDKTVDASTCMFPEKTWYVKNFGHTISTLLPELTYAILYADKEVTVDTYEDYPRFIIYNENGEFVPQTADDTKSFFEKIADFFSQIFNFFKMLFDKIFG